MNDHLPFVPPFLCGRTLTYCKSAGCGRQGAGGAITYGTGRALVCQRWEYDTQTSGEATLLSKTVVVTEA